MNRRGVGPWAHSVGIPAGNKQEAAVGRTCRGPPKSMWRDFSNVRRGFPRSLDDATARSGQRKLPSTPERQDPRSRTSAATSTSARKSHEWDGHMKRQKHGRCGRREGCKDEKPSQTREMRTWTVSGGGTRALREKQSGGWLQREFAFVIFRGSITGQSASPRRQVMEVTRKGAQSHGLGPGGWQE